MNLFRATVRSYNTGAYTATIEPIEGATTQIEDVPVLYPQANASDMIADALVLCADLGDGHYCIIGKISTGTPALTAHMADPDAHHDETHTHPGSDITSQVSDADTVDGEHAAAFADASHTHPGSDITSQVSDAHTVDSLHAATTPTANRLLSMDSNTRFPSHRVTASLGMTADLIMATSEGWQDGILSRAGWKFSFTSGTAYDAVTFTCAGGTNSVSYRASITLLLLVTAQCVDTGGTHLATSGALFLVTVYKNKNSTMGMVIQQIGSTNQHDAGGTSYITIAASSASAGSTSIKLQLTFTMTSADVYAYAGWGIIGYQYSNQANVYITATVNNA
jgi:hypothetical protein